MISFACADPISQCSYCASCVIVAYSIEFEIVLQVLYKKHAVMC